MKLKKSGLPEIYKNIIKEKNFIYLLVFLFMFGGIIFKIPIIAGWFGFILASYSVVSNDSIQTIGTFLASNRSKNWIILWVYIGLIFLLTTTYSWLIYSGDVSYGRLASKGFENSPTSFNYLQVVAPLFLLILTKLKMPVSTTFLILSSFATTGSSIGKILFKSVSGYFLAFSVALIIWLFIHSYIKKAIKKKKKASSVWRIFQWLTSGTLWSIWLMQDAANIAVYLPREMSLLTFGLFCSIIIAGLGILMYYRGGKIQTIILEKSYVEDVRPATIIDVIYSGILFYFKMINKIPLSTTWVFVGFLGGRELAINIMSKEKKRNYKKVGRMLARDITYLIIGLLVSLILSISINPIIRKSILGF